MTLEELRLRIEVEFPRFAVSAYEDTLTGEFYGFILAELPPRLHGAMICGERVRQFCAFVWHDGLSISALNGDAVAGEIERRILSVTAHNLIAARRRLQGAEPCSPPTT